MRSAQYNYPRFRLDYYNLDEFPGPSAGEPFPDFELTTSDGRTLTKADLLGSWVVLETGSITCPMYISNIAAMNALATRYPEVSFYVLYVREAHPGERTGATNSTADKESRSQLLKQLDNEKRTILLDDVSGELHRQIGLLPDSVYVINPEGIVAFRSDWNRPDVTESVLTQRQTAKFEAGEHVEPRKPSPLLAVRVLRRGGFLAIADFLRALSLLAWTHWKQRNRKTYKPRSRET